MHTRKIFVLSLFSGLLGFITVLAAFGMPAGVYADEPISTPDQGTCIGCHDNLYFLHDTGKWFCLQEAPMACIDCHGGNPTATTQETAHAHRDAHPIVNENVSKCQECHPEQASERVKIFGQVAGIGAIMVALPFQPVIASEMEITPVTGTEKNSNWIPSIEAAIIILLAGLALTARLIYTIRHKTHPHF